VTRGASTTVRVRVIAGARDDRIDGERNGALLVRVRAPAQRNRANDALRKLLAGELGVRPAAVRIVAGQRSRDKRVSVEGAAPELAALLAGHGVAPE